jgi:hypothetical protein
MDVQDGLPILCRRNYANPCHLMRFVNGEKHRFRRALIRVSRSHDNTSLPDASYKYNLSMRDAFFFSKALNAVREFIAILKANDKNSPNLALGRLHLYYPLFLRIGEAGKRRIGENFEIIINCPLSIFN